MWDSNQKHTQTCIYKLEMDRHDEQLDERKRKLTKTIKHVLDTIQGRPFFGIPWLKYKEIGTSKNEY